MPLQPENIAEVQREVQRKLGRNLLRIQQLEVMVKSMVAHSVIESESGDMHSFRRGRQATRRQGVRVGPGRSSD